MSNTVFKLMNKSSEFNYTLVFGYYTNKTSKRKVVEEKYFNFKDDSEAIDLCEKFLGHFGKTDKQHKRIFVEVARNEPFCIIKVKYCDRDF